jgi:hypothetical protein
VQPHEPTDCWATTRARLGRLGRQDRQGRQGVLKALKHAVFSSSNLLETSGVFYFSAGQKLDVMNVEKKTQQTTKIKSNTVGPEGCSTTMFSKKLHP